MSTEIMNFPDDETGVEITRTVTGGWLAECLKCGYYFNITESITMEEAECDNLLNNNLCFFKIKPPPQFWTEIDPPFCPGCYRRISRLFDDTYWVPDNALPR